MVGVSPATLREFSGVPTGTRPEIRVLTAPMRAKGAHGEQAVDESTEDFLALPMVL